MATKETRRSDDEKGFVVWLKLEIYSVVLYVVQFMES